MRFFISDTHFGHRNIIKYSNRPFNDVDHMNQAIIENWNNTVTPDDTVYHLGDVALGPWTAWDDILSRLNGHIILVVGNHDRIFKGEKPSMQERFAEHYSRWFEDIHHNIYDFRLRNGHMVNLSHFPYDGDSHDGDRYVQYRPVDQDRTLIHGHTHAEFAKYGKAARISRSKRNTVQIHVGADAWNYTPVSENEIIALLDGTMEEAS